MARARAAAAEAAAQPGPQPGLIVCFYTAPWPLLFVLWLKTACKYLVRNIGTGRKKPLPPLLCRPLTCRKLIIYLELPDLRLGMACGGSQHTHILGHVEGCIASSCPTASRARACPALRSLRAANVCGDHRHCCQPQGARLRAAGGARRDRCGRAGWPAGLGVLGSVTRAAGLISGNPAPPWCMHGSAACCAWMENHPDRST